MNTDELAELLRRHPAGLVLRWQDLGAYRVIRGGRLVPDASDASGQRVVGGVVVVEGKIGGERREMEEAVPREVPAAAAAGKKLKFKKG